MMSAALAFSHAASNSARSSVWTTDKWSATNAKQLKEEHLALGIGWSADTLVFDNGLGEIRRPRNFTKEVSRIAAGIGVNFTPHLGRHDHFTRLLETGVHPEVTQPRAGHSSIAVTMDVYSHATASL